MRDIKNLFLLGLKAAKTLIATFVSLCVILGPKVAKIITATFVALCVIFVLALPALPIFAAAIVAPFYFAIAFAHALPQVISGRVTKCLIP